MRNNIEQTSVVGSEYPLIWTGSNKCVHKCVDKGGQPITTATN